MSTGFTPITDLYIGFDRELGRIGVICTVPYMAIYTYGKGTEDNKLSRIPWPNIYRFEVSHDQVEITFKRVPAKIAHYKEDQMPITFRCPRALRLIAELINLNLIKVCDRAVQLLTNRIFYKPKVGSANFKNMRYLVTEDLFQELDPQRIPLIEL